MYTTKTTKKYNFPLNLYFILKKVLPKTTGVFFLDEKVRLVKNELQLTAK